MVQFSSLYGSRLDEELGSADSTVLFTTARRQSAINRGVVEFAELTECYERSSTITIVGGTAEYDLNSTTIIVLGDFIRLSKQQVEFRYIDASSNETVLAGDDLRRRDLDWLNVYEPGWQTSTTASSVMQLPRLYYERMQGGHRYLGFWPTPSTGSSASARAIVQYIAMPTPMTSDTQEPFFSVGSRTDLRPFHQAVVHFAAYQLEKLRRDTEASNAQLQRFLGYVQRFMQNTRVKGGTAITQGRSYFIRGNPGTQMQRKDPRT